MAGALDSLTTDQIIAGMYVGYLNLAPAASGFTYWITQYLDAVQSGQSSDQALVNIANSFVPQPETLAIYPFLNTGGPLSPSNPADVIGVETLVENIYLNLFNLTVVATYDPANNTGANYWVNGILDGKFTLGEAVLVIENGAYGTGAETLLNKITVADFFAQQTLAHNIGVTPPLPTSVENEAAIVLEGVTSDPATVTSAEALISAYVQVQVTNLGTSVETVTTTAAGDEVAGVINYQGYEFGTNTFIAGDQINMNGGTVQVADNGGALYGQNDDVNNDELSGITITGPYKFVVSENGFEAGNFDFTINNTVLSVTSLNSATEVFFDDLPTGTQVIASGGGQTADVFFSMLNPTDAVNVTVNGGVNGVTIEYKEWSASNGNDLGAATSATINSTGAANGFGSAGADIFELTFAGHSIASLTINAATNLKAELIDSDYASGASLQIAGAATDVDLTANQSDIPFGSIDASGLTAGNLLIYADDKLASFKGGASGGNELLFDGTDHLSSSATSIDGGGGTENILSAQLVDVSNGAIFTDWQILDITGLGATAGSPFDAAIMTKDAITGVQFTGDDATSGGDYVLDLAPAATVLVQGLDIIDNGLTLTHSAASGDSLAVTFNATGTGLSHTDLGFLVSTGDPTVSIASNQSGTVTSGPSTYNELGQLAETDNVLTTVTVSGATPLYLGADTGNANSGDGVVTDIAATAASATTVASSLTLIDASATIGGVNILAGATNTNAAGTFLNGGSLNANVTVTYDGLTIKGGSGQDSIENDANNGVVIEQNHADDFVDLGGANASATLGTGAGDSATVGYSDLGTNEVAGKALNDTITFSAGATALLSIGIGAEAGSTAGTSSIGQSSVQGAAAGMELDFLNGANLANVINANAAITSATSLAQAENDAVGALSGGSGVAFFNSGGNTFLVAVHTTGESEVEAADQVVELVGVTVTGIHSHSGLIVVA